MSLIDHDDRDRMREAAAERRRRVEAELRQVADKVSAQIRGHMPDSVGCEGKVFKDGFSVGFEVRGMTREERLAAENERLRREVETMRAVTHRSITVIANGEPVPLIMPLDATLETIRRVALRTARTAVYPPDRYEIRTEGGALIEPDRRLRDVDLGDVWQIYLTLPTGWGG